MEADRGCGMIDKETGASLRKAGIWTTDVPNYLIEQIRNPDALAIWVYLLKQSAGWCVRRAHLMDHFGIGRDRYQTAIKVLKDMELFWTYQVKDASGRITDNAVVVSMLPASDLERMSSPGIQDSVSSDSPGIQVSGRPENPASGKTDHLITGSKESNNGSKGINAGEYPDDFEYFWTNWPEGFGSKGGKLYAYAEWRKAKSLPSPSELISIANRQADEKAARKVSDGFAENFKHVCRWLKGREWENDAPTLRAVSGEVYR
jgi:hypothetical protein